MSRRSFISVMQESKRVRIHKPIKTKRSVVLASILFVIFMAAIEGTIVATAIPSIVGDLGGFSLFSFFWHKQ